MMRMKRHILTLLIVLTWAVGTNANGWDEAQYRQIEQSIRQPLLTDKAYVITKFGARSDASAAQNQKAIQKAIDRCSKRGGGRVVVPQGMTFLTAAIQLKSGVCLEVQQDATLQFVFEPELYPIVETSWEGLQCFNLSPCIYAFQAHDIAITGKGTIDGGGSVETWWPWCGAARYGWHEGMISQRTEARPRLLRSGEDGVPMYDAAGHRSPERTFGPTDGLRPQLVGFNRCERVLIEDVTLLRSPFWVIHPLHSTDVTVRRVKMINDGPNGDGCDPECCDRVLIEDCFFNTGDDCIAIKSGRNRDGRERAMASKNIIIRRCEMKNGHGGVVVGSEISGGCQNVYAHDCVMDSPSLERVLRIKTNSCRGGIIENINMRDIEVGQCAEAVVKINLDYEHNEVCCRGFNPTVRHINIENVNCQRSKYGVLIIALDTVCNVYDVNLRNCRFDGVAQGNKVTGLTRDINYDRLFVNGSLCLTEMPYKHYSEWMTYSEMKRTPQPYLLDFSKKPKWSYVMGIELEGMLDTYLRYGGEDIRRYCQTYTDTMINVQGDIRGYNIKDYNLDNIRTGHFVTRMYQQWPEAKNLLAMQTMMRQLEQQPRTVADKVYWHKAIYAYQVWLDGIFMGLPYRCLTAPITEEAKGKAKSEKLAAARITAIYDDAVNQLKTTYERTLDPQTGLNRHAYDETRKAFWADKETGLSQHCWGRAQGWYTMALIEVLDALPETYKRRGELIELLKKDFDAILKWQDASTGLWYQVMDAPERESNYLESTCSSMFTYALLKAYRKGYVGAKYRDAGIKAYRGIIDHFIRVDEDLTISLTQCCAVAGLGPAATPEVEAALKQVNPKGTVRENRQRDGSYAYYLSEPVRDNDPKGIGPFIWASLEMEQLEEQLVPAFPGAEGHGRYTTGGRGGRVVHVTNLNDAGPGSFRQAVKGDEPKIVVFDVGGVIALDKDVHIGANTTIAGQTAPAPGITLRYYTLQPSGDNIVVRFIRVRRGEERNVNSGADAATCAHHTSLILDHCSFSWSIDEVASFYDNNNFTLQWCTVGESLVNAGHDKGAHGYGGIWGGKLASFHHNLICHVANRSPRFNGARYDWQGYTANQRYAEFGWQNAVQAENVDFRNCVVYNCGNGCYGGPGGGRVNMVNNFYKTGPAAKTTRLTQVTVGAAANANGMPKYWTMTSRYYLEGNQLDDNRKAGWAQVAYDDGTTIIDGEHYSPDPNHYNGDDATYAQRADATDCIRIRLSQPTDAGSVTTHTAAAAFERVLAYAGASLHRDDVDRRYAAEALSGTATYSGSQTRTPGRIDRVADVHGYTEADFPTAIRPAHFDTDGDGMPDAWEEANGLNPADPADGKLQTIDPTGRYTNVEVYLNSLVQHIMLAGNRDSKQPVAEYYPPYTDENHHHIAAIHRP